VGEAVRTIITGTCLLPDGEQDGWAVAVEGERIIAVGPQQSIDLVGDVRIDAADGYVAPGYIDIHTHGAAGYDTMDADPSGLACMGRFLARHGVTAYLPTTITAAREDITAAVTAVQRAQRSADAARPLGVHLEGPYLNPSHRGAQPLEHLRLPAAAEFDAWLSSGTVRLITLAPELDGALDLIEHATEAGVRTAVGHTDATYEEVLAAAGAGLTQATHTFNGMPPLHHRAPGPVGAALTDPRVFAQVIADGVHLHPAVLDLIIRAKGCDRTILVSDAMRATGLPDGIHDLGGQQITVKDGVPRTPEGGLAGSTLTLDAAVRHVHEHTGLAVAECVRMASATPAAAMGWGDLGALRPGSTADIVVLGPDLTVLLTMIDGHIAYDRNLEVRT
jgi:N-acetylglucosamine-6-phosphate deacetylase